MRHTQSAIKIMAKRAKLCVSITNLGDGKTRYEFFMPGPTPHTFDRTLCYCEGAREAWLFLRGWLECQDEREYFSKTA